MWKLATVSGIVMPIATGEYDMIAAHALTDGLYYIFIENGTACTAPAGAMCDARADRWCPVGRLRLVCRAVGGLRHGVLLPARDLTDVHDTPFTDCPTSCVLTEDCHCSTTDVPGGMKADNVPQFIVLTVDDPITPYTMKQVLSITTENYNRNGCGVPAT